jgi:hypothetical protein
VEKCVLKRSPQRKSFRSPALSTWQERGEVGVITRQQRMTEVKAIKVFARRRDLT